MASKLKLTELLYPTSTTPAITLNSDNTVTFGASTTTITNLSATSITDSGNLNFTGTGNRITGDFSNATVANRVAIQTSTTNGNTAFFYLPNGTSQTANAQFHNASDPTNAANMLVGVTSSDATLRSGITGTGTYLPMTFYTGGSERVRIDTSGNVGIGTSSPSGKLDVQGAGTITSLVATTDTSGANIARLRVVYTGGGGGFNSAVDLRAGDNYTYLLTQSNTPLLIGTNNTERMRITSAGEIGIGTSSPILGKLNVTTGFAATDTTQRNLAFFSSSDTAVVGSAPTGLYFSYTGAAALASRTADIATVTYGSGNLGALSFQFGKMLLDSSGNLGLGVTPSAWNLGGPALQLVGGASFVGNASRSYINANAYWNGSNWIRLNTNYAVQQINDHTGGCVSWNRAASGAAGSTIGFSESMRIDENGNLLVGTTSTFNSLNGVGIVRSSGNWQLLALRHTLASGGAVVNLSNGTTAGIGWDIGLLGSQSAFSYRYNANVVATINESTGAYTAVSDINKKKNLEASSIGLEAVMQIETKLFNMIEDADDAPKHLGFIAQQVKPFIPQAYVESGGFIGLQDRPILAAAIKAIQEQQAIIETLQTRLTALEGN